VIATVAVANKFRGWNRQVDNNAGMQAIMHAVIVKQNLGSDFAQKQILHST
jgi:hypothetical protein